LFSYHISDHHSPLSSIALRLYIDKHYSDAFDLRRPPHLSSHLNATRIIQIVNPIQQRADSCTCKCVGRWIDPVTRRSTQHAWWDRQICDQQRTLQPWLSLNEA